MNNTPNRPRILRAPVLAAVLGVLILLVGGCEASGDKADRLVQRARAQIAEMQPHPEFVPTPLPADDGGTGTSPLVAPDSALAPPQADTPEPGSPVASATGQAQPAQSPKAAGSGAARAIAPAPSVERSRPASTALPESTSTSTATAAPTATATPAYLPAQPAVALAGLAHYWQNWNNCGPATLAMNLSYFGSKLGQDDISAVLRTDRDDKNVNPDEMVAYARAQGFQAVARINGNSDELRLLLSNGVPVIVETWMEPKPNDGMGHYRLITGYDDAPRQWIAYDSYESRGVDPKKPYAGMRLGYDELEPLWRVFDHTYIVVFTDRQAAQVAGIIGPDMVDSAMWERAEQDARAGLGASPGDAFGWFNLGTDLVGQRRYGEAAAAYDQARRLGLPWRMLWYQFGPFRAYYETARYREVVALADATLKTTNNLEEVWYWRGMGLKGQGDAAGARQAWQRALQLNRNYRDPADSLAALGG